MTNTQSPPLPLSPSPPLETDLRTYRPSDLESLPADFVWPRYEGLSVGNLAATMAGALGATLPGALPPLRADLLNGMLDGVRRVVLVVIDALGWEQLRWVMDNDADSPFHRLAEQGRLLPLTTVSPSTTTNVLSTIWSGFAPVQHGQLAYEMWLREWLMVVESIAFSSPHEAFKRTLMRWGFEPEKFQPIPAIGEQLAAQGVPGYALTFKEFVDSPLSRMNHRGMAEVYKYSTNSDFWVTLRRTLMEYHTAPRALFTGYLCEVDTLAHAWGPFDETGDAEIRTLGWQIEEVFLKQLPAAAREGTLLLLTADHGQLATPPSAMIPLNAHPQLYDALVIPPVGEARVPFFYIRHGHYDAVWEYLHTHLAEQFVFMSQEEVLQTGLLGPGEMYAEVPHRLGDIIGFAKGRHYLAHNLEKSAKTLGRHGGLHAQEMLVPLLALRLDG
ncbi:MAG TPA: alkaline phosphatase family protein [Anaerolineae bacterium]|nr:alkaline phosphatase family protein [Anaerolineae bacterium]